jgi:hypothetical protein
MTQANPIITAVRERLDRLHGQLPTLELDADRAAKAHEQAKALVSEMKNEIDALGRFLESPPEMVLAPDGPEEKPQPEATGASRAANLQILIRARALLDGGRTLPTREIYEGLLRQGQVFTAQNPVQRLSQILSASDWFMSDRAKGWSLKSEAPTGATNTEGASSATESDGS